MERWPGATAVPDERRQAGKAGLLELVGELIERAKTDGPMREDFTAADVPSLMRGLARATAPSTTARPR